ncbi:hypothetical protein J1N35_014452 [Gossypium stocksii]|uniref:Uncharacterized protein n=1 Tax=Gossypium stocksii TaxID=47602 RepID=A0A9D3VWJ1_9ROSI|nr:hypothetical protein J1N35_014452 [Gossypium stocksii]
MKRDGNDHQTMKRDGDNHQTMKRDSFGYRTMKRENFNYQIMKRDASTIVLLLHVNFGKSFQFVGSLFGLESCQRSITLSSALSVFTDV